MKYLSNFPGSVWLVKFLEALSHDSPGLFPPSFYKAGSAGLCQPHCLALAATQNTLPLAESSIVYRPQPGISQVFQVPSDQNCHMHHWHMHYWSPLSKQSWICTLSHRDHFGDVDPLSCKLPVSRPRILSPFLPLIAMSLSVNLWHVIVSIS